MENGAHQAPGTQPGGSRAPLGPWGSNTKAALSERTRQSTERGTCSCPTTTTVLVCSALPSCGARKCFTSTEGN